MKPVNLTLPAITGSFAPGGTITASPGTWSNTPTSFSYQWRRARAHEFLASSFWAPGQTQPWTTNLGRYIAQGSSLTMTTPFTVAYEDPADTARIQTALAVTGRTYPYVPYFGERYSLPDGLGINAVEGGGYVLTGVVCEVTATNADGSTVAVSKLVREHGVKAPWGPGPNAQAALVATPTVTSATTVRLTFNDHVDPFAVPTLSSLSITGKTIQSARFYSGFVTGNFMPKLELTFSPAIVNFGAGNSDTEFKDGDPRYLSYTKPGTNPIQSLGQLQLANLSNLRIGR